MTGARLHCWITGRVQGVAYRAYTQREATRLGLTGWVRNCPDGRVEWVAEGERETLEQLVVWCHQGSPLARVAEVKTQWEDETGIYSSFDIRR